MSLRKTLDLKPLEWEILKHRLDVDDCIADALTDDTESTYHREDVEAIAQTLADDDLEAALDMSDEITHEVLADAVDGSTYLGAASELSMQKQNVIYTAGESLATKVGNFINRELSYPTY